MSEAAEKKWSPPPAGSPCWIEIPATDVAACKKFYSGLFPAWTFSPATEQYPEHKIAMWSSGGNSGLGGGIVCVSPECKSTEHKMGVGMTVYYFVDSIEETQKRVEELGGISVTKKEPEGENGWTINFKDVEGNRFGAYTLRKPGE